MRVLHIEDMTDIAFAVECTLQGHVTLDHASDLAEAKVLLGDNDYDVLLVDLNLPDSEGVGTIEKLKRFKTPIVVLSGLNECEFLARAAEAGADDYICKPNLKLAELLGRLTFAASKRKRRKMGVSREMREYVGCSFTATPFRGAVAV